MTAVPVPCAWGRAITDTLACEPGPSLGTKHLAAIATAITVTLTLTLLHLHLHTLHHPWWQHGHGHGHGHA